MAMSTIGRPRDRRVQVIADARSKLYKFAETANLEPPHDRGRSEQTLRDALAAMASEVGMVVLDGHGDFYQRDETPQFASGLATRVPFDPPALPETVDVVVLAMCWGGTDPYVRAVRCKNPTVVVVGPTEKIYSATYRDIVEPLIEGWAHGRNVNDVLAELAQGRSHLAARWVVHP